MSARIVQSTEDSDRAVILIIFSPRQAVAPQTQTSPYIQQLYAASANPYGQVSPNIMQLMQSSTGNPLLDMYTNQYAAMGSMGYHPPSTAAAVTQPAVLPASQSLAIDAGQANAAVAGISISGTGCTDFNK